MVKFANEQDYYKALTGGSWMILDHYKMVAWVRFPHLPIHFCHVQVLTLLGNLIEKTVKIGFNTQRAKRGNLLELLSRLTSMNPFLQWWFLMVCSNMSNTRTCRHFSSIVVGLATNLGSALASLRTIPSTSLEPRGSQRCLPSCHCRRRCRRVMVLGCSLLGDTIDQKRQVLQQSKA
ncbi:hypothetical protein LINPERHAP1_LOCUS6806 [Linum perenne]